MAFLIAADRLLFHRHLHALRTEGYSRGNTLRCGEHEGVGEREAETQLFQRRHIGEVLVALVAHGGERLELAGARQFAPARAAPGEVDLAAEHRLKAGGAAVYRHDLERHAGLLREHHGHQPRGGDLRGHRQRLARLLGIVEHILERIPLAVAADDDGVFRLGQSGEVPEIVNLVGDFLVELRRQGVGGARTHADRVAVGLGVHELGRHHSAAAARLGHGDHRLAEDLLELGGDQAAGGVDRAAGLETDPHGDRLLRISRGVGEPAGQRRRQDGG